MDLFFVVLSFAVGGLLPVQAGANAQLAKALGSPYRATTLQLAIGASALLLVAAATSSLGALASLLHVPWWHLLGGAASALYVASTILLFPRLGAVTSVGLLIAGQILASLTLDLLGLLGVAAHPMRVGTVMGAVAVLLGTVAILHGSPRTQDRTRVQPGWIGLALLAGAGLPIQGAVNAILRHDLGSPAVVGLVSFVVATAVMAALLVLSGAFRQQRSPDGDHLSSMPWWGWLGGLIGAAYVTTVFSAIPVIGAAPAIGLAVAGQQAASILVDRYGWLRLPRRPVTGPRLAGAALLLCGVAIIKIVEASGH